MTGSQYKAAVKGGKKVTEPEAPAKTSVPAMRGAPKKSGGSAVSQGIDTAAPEVTKPTTPSKATKAAPSDDDIDHRYGPDSGYSQPAAGDSGDDDEEGARASSIVADKAAKMLRGRGGDNSVLVNELGERIIVQSFYSFPVIDGRAHQIYNAASPLDTGLAAAFASRVNLPTTNKGTGKIQYGRDEGRERGKASPQITDEAVQKASKAIADVFKGQPLATHQKRPIFWVNADEHGKAGVGSFALSHWIRIPPDTKLEDALKAGTVEHYMFGYYNTAGVPEGAVTNMKSMFGGFDVGTIEATMGFYGLGANALKRISALKPSRVMGADAGRDQLTGLDYEVAGDILKNPWEDINRLISDAYAKTPVKRDKLLEITEQIIGTGPSEPGKYPIDIKGISVKTVGFSTNALTVDFMEILHPLVAMKPNGVLNNGIYAAAQTYLGSRGRGGKVTFNLQDCYVGYPAAANAKLFDSMLINRKTGGRLLISSKDEEGAMPGAGSLGSVFNLFEQNLDSFASGGGNLDPEMADFVSRTMAESPPEFRQMMSFFSSIGRGNKDKAAELMPTRAGAKELARKLVAGDKVADLLNTWDGGNKFGGGKFLEFCTSILRYTPLVQMNTMSRKHKDTPEFDRADDLTITGFMATWPNNIFDNIYFADSPSGLKFKIDVGGGKGIPEPEPTTGKTTAKRGKVAAEPAFDKWQGIDYTGKAAPSPRYTYTSNINKKKVPGFGGTWNVLVNKLSGMFEDFLKGNEWDPDLSAMDAVDDAKFMALFDTAWKFQAANGFDPGMSKVPGMTVRDLMTTIQQATE